MTIRQQFLKAFYPFIIGLTKLMGKNNSVVKNEKKVPPLTPIYHLSITLNNGSILPLKELAGKKILFVNTASDCGYTRQYASLQALYQQYQGTLEIIGFPANDFKTQEKGDDSAITKFCQVNYGVTFPLASKSSVVASANQHPVYRWLTDKSQNGWNTQIPSWNFSKYLVNEQGILTHYFDPSVLPDSAAVIQAIQ